MLSKEIQLEVNKGHASIDGVYTIQGFHTGTAYFVRIGGCDVGCHWCDVKSCFTSPTSVDLVVANASKYAETVVVTEEPLMWI
jgi:organic radical activating enzyme